MEIKAKRKEKKNKWSRNKTEMRTSLNKILGNVI
jgi:hypothetical protein